MIRRFPIALEVVITKTQVILHAHIVWRDTDRLLVSRNRFRVLLKIAVVDVSQSRVGLTVTRLQSDSLAVVADGFTIKTLSLTRLCFPEFSVGKSQLDISLRVIGL